MMIVDDNGQWQLQMTSYGTGSQQQQPTVTTNDSQEQLKPTHEKGREQQMRCILKGRSSHMSEFKSVKVLYVLKSFSAYKILRCNL